MRISRSFFAIGIILLLWNLMGVAAFVTQYGADLTELAKTDPDTARIFAAMPGWVWAIYAIAVSAGTLGAVMLLLRKAGAAPLFLISLVAVILQFGYTFLATDLLATKGPTTAIFPAIIFIIALVQWLYVRGQVAKGVLR